MRRSAFHLSLVCLISLSLNSPSFAQSRSSGQKSYEKTEEMEAQAELLAIKGGLTAASAGTAGVLFLARKKLPRFTKKLWVIPAAAASLVALDAGVQGIHIARGEDSGLSSLVTGGAWMLGYDNNPLPRPNSQERALDQEFLESVILMGDITVEVETPNHVAESEMVIDHKIVCGGNFEHDFQGVLFGVRTPSGRILVSELMESRDQVRMSLGQAPKKGDKLAITLKVPSHCQIAELEIAINHYDFSQIKYDDGLSNEELYILALQHSPELKVRHDLLTRGKRLSDRPQERAWSVHPHFYFEKNGVYASGKVVEIRYTEYFTHEDTKRDIQGLVEHVATWTRRIDIERSYSVFIEEFTGKVVDRQIHSGLIKNSALGHGIHEFNGEFVTGTQHPILWVQGPSSPHNTFGDQPGFAWDERKANDVPAYHIAVEAETRITNGESRESLVLKRPSILLDSDRETLKEGARAEDDRISDYVWVQVDARKSNGTRLSRGEFKYSVALKLNNKGYGESGVGSALVESQGHDMFGYKSFAAIRMNHYHPQNEALSSFWQLDRAVDDSTEVGFRYEGSDDVEVKDIQLWTFTEVTDSLGRTTLKANMIGQSHPGKGYSPKEIIPIQMIQ